MEPISMILEALSAGGVLGGDNADDSAAYLGLRDALRPHLAGRPADQDAVERYTGDPQRWRSVVEPVLRESDADRDHVVVEAARRVLAALDRDGTTAGKYRVNLAGAQGVQVGDHGFQTNIFRSTKR